MTVPADSGGAPSGTSGEPIRVFILVPYGYSPERWSRAYDQGQRWERTAYGYGRARGGLELQWATDAPRTFWLVWLRRALFFILRVDLVHTLQNWQGIRNADVVWTHTEREYLPTLLLLRWRERGRRKPRVLAQSVWLWDDWAPMSWIRRAALRPLLRPMEIEVVMSAEDASIARSVRRAMKSPCTVVQIPYGTADIHQGVGRRVSGEESGPRRPFVLCPGNDRDRDWPLVCAAAREVPEVDFVIASPRRQRLKDCPPNVRVVTLRDRAAFAHAYLTCLAVLLPLRPNTHASGCTVTMEAMSAGANLITTTSPGLDDYTRDYPWHQACGAGSVEDIVAAVRHFHAEGAPGGNRSAEGMALVSRRGLTEGDYVARFVLLTQWLMGRRPFPSEVQEFAPVADATLVGPSE